jgi:uncharacterized protein YabE (DUF348 family)
MKKKFLKSFHRKRKHAVKKSKFLFRHPLLLPVTTFVVLFFFGLFGFVMLGASTQGASDARIVNVYIDGEQQTVTTRADTIGELIERLDVSLQPQDIVEPAKDEPILEDNTQVNVYRARPVELTEGERVITVVTAHRAPRLIAEDAGIQLLPEDEAVLNEAELNVLESGATERLVIKRSVEIRLSVYGVLKPLRTTAETVSELFQREELTPGENEVVQPGIDSKITEGMLVALNRPGVKIVAVEEPIAYDVEVKNDDSITAGQVQLDKKGRDGLRAVVYEITEDEEGKEKSRTKIQTVVVRKPVTEIRLRGTKIVAPSFNPSVTVSGDKAALMSAAGIPESDYAFVDSIISKESGWRPGAVNSSSGAYGLCQALPASKMASAGSDYRTNPVTQLRWCSGYASGRYGGWSGAYSAWQVQRWW